MSAIRSAKLKRWLTVARSLVGAFLVTVAAADSFIPIGAVARFAELFQSNQKEL